LINLNFIKTTNGISTGFPGVPGAAGLKGLYFLLFN